MFGVIFYMFHVDLNESEGSESTHATEVQHPEVYSQVCFFRVIKVWSFRFTIAPQNWKLEIYSDVICERIFNNFVDLEFSDTLASGNGVIWKFWGKRGWRFELLIYFLEIELGYLSRF